MKSILVLILAFTVCISMPLWVRCQAVTNGAIIAGESVAGVKLGSSLTDFETVFPRHPDTDEEVPSNWCLDREYHWVDIDLGATGVYAYLKNSKIYNLSVHTPRFALPNGIKVQTSMQQVKRHYPDGQAYVLLHSGSPVVGGRDLDYWVDEKAGVAFELYWNQAAKQRFVSGIDIFVPGADYHPQGCVAPPWQWQELKQPLR